MSHAVPYQPRHKSHYFSEKVNEIKKSWRESRENKQLVTMRNNQLRDELRDVGLTKREMMRPETYNLSDVLFADEKIIAAVCGRTGEGVSMLLMVTNFRVVCVNHIPLFIDADEFSYSSVSGVSFDMGRWRSTIILHSAIGEFPIHTSNQRAAKKFVDSVERAVITSSNDQHTVDYHIKNTDFAQV